MNAIHTAASTGATLDLPLRALQTVDQIRTRNGFDAASIKELAASIEAVGLLQPIIVTPTGADVYTVIAGHRRLAAVRHLGYPTISAVVRDTDPVDSQERSAAQAVENIQRQDLHILDKAEGVASLVASVGSKVAARLLGRSGAWVSKTAGIAKLPEAVRALAQDNVTDDPEILHALRHILKLDEAVFRKLDDEMRAGTADRAAVRATLARLRAGDMDGEADSQVEGDEDGKEDTGKETAEKFGKLELAESSARSLLRALKLAQKTKSTRATEALIQHVDGFIVATWK